LRRARPRLAPVLLAPLVLARAAGAGEPAAPSRAPARGLVIMALPRCESPPYDAAELWAALGLELGQRGLATHAAEPGLQRAPDVTLALSRCGPDAEWLDVRVVGAAGAGVSERKVWLVETPFEARARTLALLIAELLPAPTAATAPDRPAAEDPLAVVRHEPLAPPTGAPVDAALARPAPEPALPTNDRARPLREQDPRVQLGAAIHGRSSIEALQLFWGPELNLRVPVSGPLDAAVEAGLGAHSERTWLGALDVRWWSVSGGVDWSFRGALDWHAGPRFSFAHVAASGDPRAGWRDVHQSENILSIGARGGLGVPLGGAWQLSVALELQRALRGLVLNAGGERSVSLDGVLAGAGLGVSYTL
jgi:hypothetical protein